VGVLVLSSRLSRFLEVQGVHHLLIFGCRDHFIFRFYYVYAFDVRALEALWIGDWEELRDGLDAAGKRKSIVLLQGIEPPFPNYPACILATLFVSYPSSLKITLNVNIYAATIFLR
jgi:hypothetical protein